MSRLEISVVIYSIGVQCSICISTSYLITGVVALQREFVCTIVVGKFDIKTVDDFHCKYIIIKKENEEKRKKKIILCNTINIHVFHEKPLKSLNR